MVRTESLATQSVHTRLRAGIRYCPRSKQPPTKAVQMEHNGIMKKCSVVYLLINQFMYNTQLAQRSFYASAWPHTGHVMLSLSFETMHSSWNSWPHCRTVV
jgi:hypothetical protein